MIAASAKDAPDTESAQFKPWLAGRYLVSRGLAGYVNNPDALLLRMRRVWTEIEPIWTQLMDSLRQALPEGRALGKVLKSIRDDPFDNTLSDFVTAPRRIRLNRGDVTGSLRAFFNVLDMGLISLEHELRHTHEVEVGFGSIIDPELYLRLASPELRRRFLGDEYPVSIGCTSSLPVKDTLFEAV